MQIRLQRAMPRPGSVTAHADSVSKGKTREEYLSVIYSRLSGTGFCSSDVNTEYAELATGHKGASPGTIFLTGKLPSGKSVDASVGLPDWLQGVLTTKAAGPK